jgi:multidrug efflux pump subunit AcrA (membrane-fusion protein)
LKEENETIQNTNSPQPLGSNIFLGGRNKLEDQKAIPINVEVRKANTQSMEESFAHNGTIEESETIPLSFPVVGTVSEVFVSEGDVVIKGQLLVSLCATNRWDEI